MNKAKCPLCGCEEFYVKNPEDEYDTFEFYCEDGQICFKQQADQEKFPGIGDETDAHCNRCSWHDKFKKLKK